MKIDILTLFPNMFEGFMSESIIKRAINNKKVEINIHDIRTFLRIYNLTSKKQFVILLKEKLSKIYADPVRIDGSIHNSDSCDMSENSGSIE